VPVVPTDQIIKAEAGGRRDVHRVCLTAFWQDAGRDVSEAKRFHRFADRVNEMVRRVEVPSDSSQVNRIRILNLGNHNVRDDAYATPAVEKAKQAMDDLLTITRLSPREAAPDARFEVEGRHRHRDIV
jgi:hypothetical protein